MGFSSIIVVATTIALVLALGVNGDSINPSRAFRRFDLPKTTSCSTCTLVLQSTWAYLHMNGSYDKIFQIMNGSCIHFPAKLQNECYSIAKGVRQYLPDITTAVGRANYTASMMCSLAGLCRIPCCQSSLPEQLHLAWTNFPGEIVVSWVTAQNDDSVVEYGLDANALTSSAIGELKDPGFEGGWDGYIHKTLVKDLIGGKRYFYRVGSPSSNLWSQVMHFVMPLSQSDSSAPVRLAVIGDMGADPQAVNTIAALSKLAQTEQLDSILHVGDISYADGDEERWDIFMREIQGYAAFVPYQTCPGNHEVAVQYYLKLQAYKNRFFMPMNNSHGRGDAEQKDMFWSANFGLMHLISLDSESALDIPLITNDQKKWVEEDLIQANQNRQAQPWIVIMIHRPLYCSSHGRPCTTDSTILTNALEDLFHKYKVDLVLQGHVHNYERSLPQYRGKFNSSYTNPNAPVYVVNGAGGNREGTNGFSGPNPAGWPFRLADWGYGIITISNSSSLQWQFFTSSDMQLKDSFTLSK